MKKTTIAAIAKRGQVRRLIEMAHAYAWGPQGSADLRDEWLCLYSEWADACGILSASQTPDGAAKYEWFGPPSTSVEPGGSVDALL